MDNRFYNIIRYFLSFCALVLSSSNPMILAAVAVALLFINNFLDDVVFYVGNRYIKVDESKVGFLSPVNGIVTKVENYVDLFSSIKKINPLTHKMLMSVGFIKADKEGTFNHVAIFLNKLNHHVVLNPSQCKDVRVFNSNTGNIEMVGDGELYGNNGEYLNNDVIVLKYETCYVVVTLDKYVSKYIMAGEKELSPRLIICKGSQCDIYFRDNISIEKSIGDIVQIGDVIAFSPFYDECHMFPYDKEAVSVIIKQGIMSCGGILGLLKENVVKTAKTFTNPAIAVSFIVGIFSYFLFTPLSYVAFSSILLFVAVRWYRHFMYALMNCVGLKPWMEKSYSVLSKISILWQRRTKKSR